MEKKYYAPDIGETFTDGIGKHSLFDAFGCQISGGIRFTNKNKFVILIDVPNSIYDDSVEGDILNYKGTGEGDQGFKYDPDNRKNGFLMNRKVKDPDSILLYFEKPRPNFLVFKHEVKYVSHTFVKRRNMEGKMRKVINFKLKIIK